MVNAKLKQTQKMIGNIKFNAYLCNVVAMLGDYQVQQDFESKIINKSALELPIKNGKIINLKTLEVRDRTKSDFLSFELDVEYTPECNFETNVLRCLSDITRNVEAPPQASLRRHITCLVSYIRESIGHRKVTVHTSI